MRISPRWFIAFVLLVLSPLGCSAEPGLSYDGRRISYTLATPDTVTLTLAARDGTHRATLFAGHQDSGRYEVFWNGKDEYGEPIPSGSYVLTLDIGREAKRDAAFGGGGYVQFTNPCSIAVDKQGALYVIDLEKTGNLWVVRGRHLVKLNSDGSPCPSLNAATGDPTQKTNILNLQTSCLQVAPDGSLYYGNGSTGNSIIEGDTAGKELHAFGGQERITGPDGKTTVRRGSGQYNGGFALGGGEKAYIRDWVYVLAFDRSKPGLDGFLYSSPKIPLAPAAGGAYLGPIVAGRHGRVYTSSTSGVVCLSDQNGRLTQESIAPIEFKTCLGMALDHAGMLYVADRGVAMPDEYGQRREPTAARVYQFWDGGDGLTPVWYLEDKEIQGLRGVAVSPDGNALYLMEDGDNFANSYAKTMVWPSLDQQGQGRLFKYDLTAQKQVRITIQVR